MKRTDRRTRMSPDSRLLITVDEHGRSLGLASRSECHRGGGILHSAYLVMIFDRQQRLLQAKRSRFKLLWPGHWDGTVAGHFWPGQAGPTTIKKRIEDEVGLNCTRLDYLFQFLYEARYGDVGIEKEVCRVYAADHVCGPRIPFNPAEVEECRLLGSRELAALIDNNDSSLTPWLQAAFLKGKEYGLF